MANVKLIFQDCLKSEEVTYNPVSECFLNSQNQITILIRDPEDKDCCESISLDKSTAIKFAKTLRTEINKIQEVGND